MLKKNKKKLKLKDIQKLHGGRRRYLAHIQDERFAFKYNDKRPVDFNPLFTATSFVNEEVSQDIKDYYINMLEKANQYRRTKIIEKAAQEGIDITNNSGYIAESNRQVNLIACMY